MGNKILDYTSIGEKKGKFDVLANNIKESLQNVSNGLGELEKGTISESTVSDFQSQINSRITELDEISEKFKSYLNYIIESNKDEDSKQSSEIAEEVGLMKQGSSGGSNGSSASPAPVIVQQPAPSSTESVAKTDYDAFKKETTDNFKKTIEDQKRIDEKQNTDFNNYRTNNDKINLEQDKQIKDVFDRLRGQESRIANLESRTTTLETTKVNTGNTTTVPVPSYTPAPAAPSTPTPPITPEQPKIEQPKKEPEIKEELPIDTKTPMEIDPSKFDEDLSKELNTIDPVNSTSTETETVNDDNSVVKAAAFGALGLGALGLGGGALYYHNKKKQENLNNEENEDDKDYLYDEF